MFPFVLHDTTLYMHCLVAQCVTSRPTDTEPVDASDTESVDKMNTEFVVMADYVPESFHDLLADSSEILSISGSCEASHHPSRECFMEDSHGAREVNNTREATPPANPSNEPKGGSHAPPAPRPNQLRDREEELEEAVGIS